MQIDKQYRKSFIELNKTYFWTASIHNWIQIFGEREFAISIVHSLQYLKTRNLVETYGFVIMPHHVHFIWQMKKMNGKEMPHISFLKHTAHEFHKNIKAPSSTFDLESFQVDKKNKTHQFWQRDSLAIELTSRQALEQKLDYIHHNPVSKKWSLVSDFVDYEFSSASFYFKNENRFDILTHYLDDN